MRIVQTITEATSMFDPTTLIQFAVGIVVLIGNAIGVFKFVQNGRDADRKEYAEHRRATELLIQQSVSFAREEINRIDIRINEVKDDYVRRPDMEKEFIRIYEMLDRDRQGMLNWMERLDKKITEQQTTINDTVTKHLS